MREIARVWIGWTPSDLPPPDESAPLEIVENGGLIRVCIGDAASQHRVCFEGVELESVPIEAGVPADIPTGARATCVEVARAIELQGREAQPGSRVEVSPVENVSVRCREGGPVLVLRRD